MIRSTVRARVRDILTEQGSDLYTDAYLNNWIDISYIKYCLLAAELDRSYFLTYTSNVSYAADAVDISVSGLTSGSGGTTSPSTPFRIIGIDDETDGTSPRDIVRVQTGAWEDRLNDADYVWLHTAPLRIGIRRVPASARTLRIWWQNIPTTWPGGGTQDSTDAQLPDPATSVIIYDVALQVLENEEGFTADVRRRRDEWHNEFVNYVALRQTDEPRKMVGGGALYS